MLENEVLEVLSSIYFEMDPKRDDDEASRIPIQIDGGKKSYFLSVSLKGNRWERVLFLKNNDHSWILRSEFDSLCSILNEFNKEIFQCEKEVGQIVDIICRAVEAIQLKDFKNDAHVDIPEKELFARSANSSTNLVRMWLKLISLSSKSKRNDLVNLGREAGFTGFIIAGKPGLLCFEAEKESDIDSLMSTVKTTSWSDVPPVQKKITVVLVENIKERAFQELEEITDSFKMGGFLENKPDMAQVRDYLHDNNVGHAFEAVFLL